MIKEYEKIETIFKRDDKTKKLLYGNFRNETIEYLRNLKWIFTEKIDGTNIRVYWDGHKVSFYGRTSKSNIPINLLNKLEELFGGEVNEEMFEQKFGDKEVILFGEGYGGNIQKGKEWYNEDINFILFDVYINSYLDRDNVEDIANYFNIKCVPVIGYGNLWSACDYVKDYNGDKYFEGIVARPEFELLDKEGNRIIVKIKTKDIKDCDFNE